MYSGWKIQYEDRKEITPKRLSSYMQEYHSTLDRRRRMADERAARAQRRAQRLEEIEISFQAQEESEIPFYEQENLTPEPDSEDEEFARAILGANPDGEGGFGSQDSITPEEEFARAILGANPDGEGGFGSQDSITPEEEQKKDPVINIHESSLPSNSAQYFQRFSAPAPVPAQPRERVILEQRSLLSAPTTQHTMRFTHQSASSLLKYFNSRFTKNIGAADVRFDVPQSGQNVPTYGFTFSQNLRSLAQTMSNVFTSVRNMDEWSANEPNVPEYVDMWYQQGQFSDLGQEPYIFGIPDVIQEIKTTNWGGQHPLAFLFSWQSQQIKDSTNDMIENDKNSVRSLLTAAGLQWGDLTYSVSGYQFNTPERVLNIHRRARDIKPLSYQLEFDNAQSMNDFMLSFNTEFNNPDAMEQLDDNKLRAVALLLYELAVIQQNPEAPDYRQRSLIKRLDLAKIPLSLKLQSMKDAQRFRRVSRLFTGRFYHIGDIMNNNPDLLLLKNTPFDLDLPTSINIKGPAVPQPQYKKLTRLFMFDVVSKIVQTHRTPQQVGRFGVLSTAGYYIFYQIVVDLLVGLRYVLDRKFTGQLMPGIICRMLGRLTFQVTGQLRLTKISDNLTRVRHHANQISYDIGLFKVVALFIQYVYSDLPELDTQFNMVKNSFDLKYKREQIVNNPMSLFIKEKPANIGAISSHNSNTNVPQPQATRAAYSQIFKQFYQELYHQAPLRPAGQMNTIMDRRVGVSYHVFPDQFSDPDLTTPVIRQFVNMQINAALRDVFQPNFLSGVNFQISTDAQMRTMVRGITLFIGFQFVKTAVENDLLKSKYRSAGFQVELSNFTRVQDGDVSWAPRQIQVQRHVKTMMRDGQERVYFSGNINPQSGSQYLQDSVIDVIMQGVSQKYIDEILAYAFSNASGSFDDDEQNWQDARLQMTGMTVFRYPVYGRDFIPIVANLRAPCGSATGQQFRQLLNENEDDIKRSVQFLQLEYEDQEADKIQCIGSAVLKFMIKLTEDHEMMSVQQLHHFVKRMMNELVTHRNNITIDWFAFLRAVLKEIKLPVPIILFIASGCQLIQFDTTILAQKKIYSMIFSGHIPNQYPVFAILNEYTETAHTFLTDLGSVKKYIDARANVKMRMQKDELGIPSCFQFYPIKLYPQRGVEKITPQQAAEEVMKSIWTLDIETYNAREESMEPYCIRVFDGYKDIWSHMSQPEQLKSAFREDFLGNLKRTRNDKSKELIIFAHNGSRFDWVIMFREVIKVFPDVKYFGRLTELKYLIIPSINVKLADFFLMVSDSLMNIANQFKTKDRKIKCEQIMDVNDFEQISLVDRDRIWDYCLNDCVVLWQCIQKFSHKICQILQVCTVPRPGFILPPTSAKLATNIFAAKFLKTTIYGTTSLQIDSIESAAYYGGVTQVFNCAKKKNMFYVDVNSLYPAAMCDILIQYRPANSGNLRNKLWKLDQNSVYELKAHNLYKVLHFEFQNNAIGMLPVRTAEGGLCYPKRYKGQNDWRTGVELMQLVKSGMLQDLQIVRELDYPHAAPGLFKEYISKIYEKQANSEGVQKMIYKLLLNQLYGKFAQRKFDKRYLVKKTSIKNDPQILNRVGVSEVNAAFISDLMRANKSSQHYKMMFQDFQKGDHDAVPILTAVNRVDQCDQYLQLVYEPKNSDVHYLGFLKRVSMMVTGYARAIMIKALSCIAGNLDLKTDRMCDHVYYMDTDSFFLSAYAFDVLNEKGLIDNSELGKFKLQTKKNQMIVQGHFFAAKVYYLVIRDDKGDTRTYCKFKGIRRRFFQELKTDKERIQVFTDMLDENIIPQLTQQRWQRSFSKIVITDIVKMTVSRPRRRVQGDGGTVFFNTVEEMEEFNQEHRLVMNHLGVYHYTQFSKTEKQK